jgi:uncharacterized protein YbbK (DUF523 family)
VSACLLGEPVRYDGRHKRSATVVDVLGPLVEWVPVCPEVELGLGVPREPIRLVRAGGATRLVAEASGADHTEAMLRHAAARVRELEGLELSGYVTKKDSPSCGLGRVAVHPSSSGPASPDGVGLFVSVLRERLPSLPIEEEDRLEHPAVRARFLERIFAYARGKGGR